MESGSFSVVLYVYDLSNGMAKSFGRQLVGMDVEGIWHSGIVVYGIEYYYGGGICTGPPKGTPYGRPVKEIHLGDTEIPRDVFMDFLAEIKPAFTMDKYDLFDNNCNNFTDECAKFLLGTGIPEFITGLPKEFLKTPIGQMLRPMIDGMKNNIIQNSNPLFLPGSFEGQNNPQALFGGGQQQSGGGSGFSVGGGDSGEVVKEIATLSQLAVAKEKDQAFVIDCFSFTCPPCMRIKPIYESIAKSYKDEAPGLKFYKCNVNEGGQEIARAFEVRSIPTFLFFFKGALIDKMSGADEFGLRTKVGTLANKIPKAPQYQIFDPAKRDLYRFADKFDTAVTKIKEKIAGNEDFKSRDNAIFDKFASDVNANVKNFKQDEKKALLRWIIGYLEVSPKDDFIPFYDLWRLLLAEDSWVALYAHDQQGHIEKILNDLVMREKDFHRSSRVFTYRALANLFHVGAGKYQIKKHLTTVNDIVLGGFARYPDDKTGLVALSWLTYNIAVSQNDIAIKEEDVTKYLDTLVAVAEKEKEEKILHAVIVALINFVYEKPARQEYIRRKNIATPLKDSTSAGSDYLKSAYEDFVLALGK